MILASYLLKYLVINKYLGIPWSKITISRKSHGKPCFLNWSKDSYIDFNVSHQAGVVVLIAVICSESEICVGTDIVCTAERKLADYAFIEDEGFFNWVHIYEDVFADSEICYLRQGSLRLEDLKIGIKNSELTNQAKDALTRCERRNEGIHLEILVNQEQIAIEIDSNVVIDGKLRQFYAMWCLKEAYAKMTGEALLAPWLKDLEILLARAPKTKEQAMDLEEGEVIEEVKTIFSNREHTSNCKVKDATVQLTALGPEYMVAAVISSSDPSGTSLKMGKWQKLDLIKDILEIAELNL